MGIRPGCIIIQAYGSGDCAKSDVILGPLRFSYVRRGSLVTRDEGLRSHVKVGADVT